MESLKQSEFIVFENNRINKIDKFDIGKARIWLLNEEIEYEFSEILTPIKTMFRNIFPSFDTSEPFIIMKKIMKEKPEYFIEPNVNNFLVLREIWKNIKSRIIHNEKILVDYETIKNISIFLLNILHYINKYSNEITLSNIISGEKLKYLPYVYSEFLKELQSIKSISLFLFDRIGTNKKKYYHTSHRSKKPKIKKEHKNNKLPKSKKQLDIYLVYVFFSLNHIAFPNKLNVDVSFSLQRYLNKYLDINGEYITTTFIKYNQDYFLILLLSAFFISNDETTQKLKIRIDDSLKLEFKEYLKDNINEFKHEIMNKFTLLDFFLFQEINAFSLSLKFNCLDHYIFEKINLILLKNTNQKYLTLNLFSNEENELSESVLNKYFNFIIDSKLQKSDLEELNEINRLQSERIESRSKHIYQVDFDEDLASSNVRELYTNLFPTFQQNLLKLFFIIEIKLKLLKKLKIVILPSNLIKDQSGYYSSLVCFIYNIFKSLESPHSNVSTFEVICGLNVNFNLLGIDSQLIDLRKSSLKELKFNFVGLDYFNVYRLIPMKIINLDLDSISIQTFCSLISNLKTNFNELVNLSTLRIKIFMSDSNFDLLERSILDFFSINKPFNLELIDISVNFALRRNFTNEVVDVIFNRSKKYKYYDNVSTFNIFIGFNNVNLPKKKFVSLMTPNYNKERIIAQLYCLKRNNRNSKIYSPRINFRIILFLFSKKRILNLQSEF